MTVASRIDAIGASIRVLVDRLTERGHRFEYPEEALASPQEDADAVIARIEGAVGVLPLALKRFWLRIGSVDLRGSHPEWQGCDYPDPLVVYPPAVALQELEEFLADKEERLRCHFPYLVPIAPDLIHKAGVSGGMWYNVSVPAVADDPPLNDEWHRTTFVRYVEMAVRWAGFPGLSRCPGHSWPVAELVQGIAGPDLMEPD